MNKYDEYCLQRLSRYAEEVKEIGPVPPYVTANRTNEEERFITKWKLDLFEKMAVSLAVGYFPPEVFARYQELTRQINALLYPVRQEEEHVSPTQEAN